MHLGSQSCKVGSGLVFYREKGICMERELSEMLSSLQQSRGPAGKVCGLISMVLMGIQS